MYYIIEAVEDTLALRYESIKEFVNSGGSKDVLDFDCRFAGKEASSKTAYEKALTLLRAMSRYNCVMLVQSGGWMSYIGRDQAIKPTEKESTNDTQTDG